MVSSFTPQKQARLSQGNTEKRAWSGAFNFRIFGVCGRLIVSLFKYACGFLLFSFVVFSLLFSSAGMVDSCPKLAFPAYSGGAVKRKCCVHGDRVNSLAITAKLISSRKCSLTLCPSRHVLHLPDHHSLCHPPPPSLPVVTPTPNLPSSTAHHHPPHSLPAKENLACLYPVVFFWFSGDISFNGGERVAQARALRLIEPVYGYGARRE